MKIFLDTYVLIEVMRKRSSLANERNGYFINPIVYGELAYGFERMGKNLAELDMYLESRQIVPLSIEVSTAKIYAKHKVKLKDNPIADNDLLVVSSCLEYGLRLWTLNKKHFARVKELKTYS
jgi:predicted nucleic acid-binding protein